MTLRSLRLVGIAIPLLGIGLTAVACGSSGGGGSNLDCSAETTCLGLCQCTTNDSLQCYAACGLPTPVGGAGGGGGVGAGGSGGGAVGGAGGEPSGDLAAGLNITEIDLYQGLKVQLMVDGNEVTNKTAIPVADREGRIRVWVNPDPDFQPREVVARVELGGSGPGIFEGKQYISGPSFEGDQNTTINIDLPPGVLKPDATYTITLHEVSPGTRFPGNQGGARWPGGGPALLGAQSTNGVFNVILVPVVVNGITPDMGPNRIQAYKDRMMKLYAVPDINIQVREAAIYTGSPPQPTGSGWVQLLDWLMNLRSFDKPPANSYYYGVVTPTNSSFQFCAGGCVAGLSNAPGDWPGAKDDVLGRTGSGLGFFPSDGNPTATDTAAHEIGHTLGLDHAPCTQFGSIEGVDGNFPNNDALIDSWGFDIITKNLLEPSGYRDMMAYCDPSWIHPYHFNKIFNRVAYANSTADVLVTDPDRQPGTFQTAIIHDDGSLTWGTTKDVPYAISAEKREVDLLDASGKVVGKVTGFFYPLDHSKGGFLYVREKLVADAPAAHSMKAAGLGSIVLK